MASARRFRVLLLDPVKHRRDQAAHALGMRFDVIEAGSTKEAVDMIKAYGADAIVATLRQMEGNGLVACKTLREAAGHDAFLLVHGPTTAPTTASARKVAAKFHRANAWAGTLLTPDEMDVIVWTELGSRQRTGEVRAGGVFHRIRRITRRDVWDFLTRHHHIIPTPPRGADEPPGWIEILNGPPSIENIRRLLTKPLPSYSPR